MFGKKEDPNRKAFREEFEQVSRGIRQADEAVQVAVGHAINMANSMFHQSFTDVADFQRLENRERIQYIHKLTHVEESLRDEKGDLPSSLGFGLFKMWVGAVSENDADLVKKFGAELAFFSQKGDLGG